MIRDITDETDAENTIGYIRLAGVPDVELWLTLSPKPILQSQRGWLPGGKTETLECRVLTVGPKKEYQFHYHRQWVGGK